MEIASAAADIRDGLARLMGKDVAQILCVRQNAAGQISIIDVCMALTKKCRTAAAADVRRMLARFPALREHVGSFKFPGQRQRDTPVADLAAMVEITLLIPGFKAIFARVEASKLILRLIRGEPQESDLLLQELMFHNEKLAA